MFIVCLFNERISSIFCYNQSEKCYSDLVFTLVREDIQVMRRLHMCQLVRIVGVPCNMGGVCNMGVALLVDGKLYTMLLLLF